MWAKGPMPGYSPRSEVLAICPTAVCRRETRGYGGRSSFTGYIVYEQTGGQAVASARSACEAWEKAYSALVNGRPLTAVKKGT